MVVGLAVGDVVDTIGYYWTYYVNRASKYRVLMEGKGEVVDAEVAWLEAFRPQHNR